MREHWLSNIPSMKSINGAIHQDEGVVISTDEGLRFIFVPQVIQPKQQNDQSILGYYNELVGDQYNDVKGDGELVISDMDTPEPSARLILL